ncbi:hypothetical protein V1512DRAFT_274373 [Lipomyces arxii]|uniref:uncharacterized protein n=1 Tax=Lipomyces arxii TaxID=56418 RepID=UPI0034CD07E8
MSEADTQPAEVSASEKARLRREKREARVLAGGADRLNKITNTAHGGQSYKQHSTPTSAAPTESINMNVYDDPPDIAPDFSRPGLGRRSSSSNLPENPIIKLLAAGRPRFPDGTDSSSAQSPDMAFDEFLRSSVPGAGGADGIGGGFDFFSQMMQQNMSADGSQSPGGANAGDAGSVPSGMIVSDHPKYWRSAHAIAVSLLAVYAIFKVGFTGSQMSRVESLGDNSTIVFWYFTTIELVLQSGRFFIEKGRSPSASIFTKVAGYIPMPYSSYVLLVGRYIHIVVNVVKDFCLLLFLLGMSAWWQGA